MTMVLSTDHSITKIDNIYVWGGALIAVFSLSWPSFAKPDTTLLALSPDYENSSSLIGGVHSLLESAEGSCRDIKRAESAERGQNCVLKVLMIDSCITTEE